HLVERQAKQKKFRHDVGQVDDTTSAARGQQTPRAFLRPSTIAAHSTWAHRPTSRCWNCGKERPSSRTISRRSSSHTEPEAPRKDRQSTVANDRSWQGLMADGRTSPTLQQPQQNERPRPRAPSSLTFATKSAQCGTLSCSITGSPRGKSKSRCL